jgi:hypothetical protein
MGVIAVCLGGVLDTADVVCGSVSIDGDEAGGSACPAAVLEEALVPRRREVADDLAAGVVGLSTENSKGCGEES